MFTATTRLVGCIEACPKRVEWGYINASENELRMPSFRQQRTVEITQRRRRGLAGMMARSRSTKPWFHSKTISVLVMFWVLFSACLGIMTVVVFVQPQWLEGRIHGGAVTEFGLYRNCTQDLRRCDGGLSSFSSIYSTEWKAATVLVAMSFSLMFLSVVIIIFHWLCCLPRSGAGFKSCSGLQAFSGLFLLVAIILYPAGWGAPAVKAVCGQGAASYVSGACEVKWGFYITVICMFDAFILSFLSLLFIEREIRSWEMAEGDRIKGNRHGLENYGRDEENSVTLESRSHARNTKMKTVPHAHNMYARTSNTLHDQNTRNTLYDQNTRNTQHSQNTRNTLHDQNRRSSPHKQNTNSVPAETQNAYTERRGSSSSNQTTSL